jgi:glycosyltransferase involved in cell wall biosynthesis
VRSILELLHSLPDHVVGTVVTSDRDLGDAVPYDGLSGRLVPYGRHSILYVNTRQPAHWLRLIALARKRRFDLMYVNSLWSPHFSVLPLLLRQLGLLPAPKVLLAPRGELAPAALAIKARKKRLFLTVWRRVLEHAGPTWHATSERDGSDISREFPWATVITSLDSRGHPPITAVLPAESDVRLVFVSRISPMKNLDFALRALQSTNTKLTLDIYGPVEDGEYWAQCQSLISQLPPDITVNYRGDLKPDQVVATFGRYDGFILPTRGENFGHAILESLSAGCPVLCSDRTMWTPVLDHGGGWALPLQLDLWAEHIASFARASARARTQVKQEALTAYTRWRGEQRHESAVEIALEQNGGLGSHA